MSIRANRRRTALSLLNQPVTGTDSFFDKYCLAIHRGKLIPIIGDTIRIAHIFDVNSDKEMGEEESEEGDSADSGNGKAVDFEKLNVTEELAYYWATSETVNYPLTDGFQMARVAQFHSLEKENPIIAKEDYLAFLKNELLALAYEMEQARGDTEEMAFIQQLHNERTLTFSQIVAELDFPHFAEDKRDPLGILARLPLKIYLTTSYHNFLERELEAAGKKPRSRLCFWNMRPEGVSLEFRPASDDRPDADSPIVYHLLGIEQYPESMVLSEDDYLDLLWALARDAPGSSHSGSGIIPPYLEAELKDASLLLLGYRLQDWDLRVLFRGLLRVRQGVVRPQWPSTVIHLDLEGQPLVQNETQARVYLERYFKQASLDVRFGDSDDFITELWQEWNKWSQGKSST